MHRYMTNSAGGDRPVTTSLMCDFILSAVVQAYYAQKGPFTKQIATEGFSTVLGQLMSAL